MFRIRKHIRIASHYAKRDHCTLSPDRLPFVGYIGWACKIHDYHYRYRNSKNVTAEEVAAIINNPPKTRKEADQMLRDHIMEAGKTRGHPIAGWIFSYLYYIGVRSLGWLVWKSEIKLHLTNRVRGSGWRKG